MRRLLILIFIPSLVFAQPTPEPVPEVDPPPTREDQPPTDDGPDNDPDSGTNIEGDLNTSNSNNGNVTKTFNGAGSRSMPASTAIAPSLTSNGTQSCLK